MEKQGERASIFYYWAKVYLYNEKIDAHVVMHKFCIPYENPVKGKMLNTVKYARATERFGN